jgi:hypothetical protein
MNQVVQCLAHTTKLPAQLDQGKEKEEPARSNKRQDEIVR